MAQDWKRSAESDIERKEDALPRLNTSMFRDQGDEKGPTKENERQAVIGKQRTQREIGVLETRKKVNTVNIF